MGELAFQMVAFTVGFVLALYLVPLLDGDIDE